MAYGSETTMTAIEMQMNDSIGRFGGSCEEDIPLLGFESREISEDNRLSPLTSARLDMAWPLRSAEDMQVLFS